mgnify:FL=1
MNFSHFPAVVSTNSARAAHLGLHYTDELIPVQTETHNLYRNPRRTEMKKIMASIVFSVISFTAFAEPCMDADVSPLGYYSAPTSDETHLEQHGC